MIHMCLPRLVTDASQLESAFHIRRLAITAHDEAGRNAASVHFPQPAHPACFSSHLNFRSQKLATSITPPHQAGQHNHRWHCHCQPDATVMMGLITGQTSLAVDEKVCHLPSLLCKQAKVCRWTTADRVIGRTETVPLPPPPRRDPQQDLPILSCGRPLGRPH